MGKVDRLRNKVDHFAALFWALGIVLANPGPWPPGRHHSTAVHKAFPYMVNGHGWFHSQRRPLPFSFLGMLFTYIKKIIIIILYFYILKNIF